MNSVTITSFKRHQKGSLQAFFDVQLPSGLVIRECKLFSKETRRWIGLPSREFVGRDGTKSYKPILEFTNREACERFREAVLAAIDGMSAGEQKPAQPSHRPAGPPKAAVPPAISDEDIPF